MADPAGTIYKLAVECVHATGGPIVNLFWFRAADGTHTGVDLAVDFITARKADWQACNNGHVTWQQVTVDTFTIETPSVPAPQTVVGSLPAAGSYAQAPPNVVTAACLAQHAILRTGLAGRSFRGRLYFGPAGGVIGGPWVESPDGIFWNATFVINFQTFLSNTLARYLSSGGSSWHWGVWSRRHGGNSHVTSGGRTVYVNKPPFHAAGFTPLISATAYAGIRTQRRREAPRGT